MNSYRSLFRWLLLSLGLGLFLFAAEGAAPALLNHQGRIAVNGTTFNGTGYFKFALVSGDGATTFWSNDGTGAAGSAPAAAVSLTVVKGLYSVLLGDTTLANMTALPPTLFDSSDVRLRVWFDDGSHGFQLISPDQRLVPAPYGGTGGSGVTGPVLLAEVMAPPLKPVVAWGNNAKGQTTVPALAGVIAVSAGNTQSLALLESGLVVGWGTGPAVPAEAVNITRIASGTGHHLARKSDGTVVAWGDNSYGQTNVPGGINNAANVAAGENHSLVLRADGTLTAWGDNTHGQCDIPAGAVNITAIACGAHHCLALTADGLVFTWGLTIPGEAVMPADLANVVAIAAGAFHSLAVKSNGEVVAWGLNTGNQIDVPAGALSGVTKVAGGYAFSMALKNDGSVLCWGDNSKAQTLVPPTATTVTAIAAGGSHALALRGALIPAQVARLDQDNVFSGALGIRRTALVNALEVEGQASKSSAGTWLSNSDRRIKTDVESLTGALETLEGVRLVKFHYSDDYLSAHPGIEKRFYLNVIAQEFAKVFPEHVKSSGEKLADGSEILQVDTYPLTIYSAAGVQELHRQNQALTKQLADQEQRLRKLESLLNR